MNKKKRSGLTHFLKVGEDHGLLGSCEILASLHDTDFARCGVFLVRDLERLITLAQLIQPLCPGAVTPIIARVLRC